MSIVGEDDWPTLRRPGVVARPFDPPLTSPLRLSWRLDDPAPGLGSLLDAFAART